jgi:hypothetical protein
MHRLKWTFLEILLNFSWKALRCVTDKVFVQVGLHEAENCWSYWIELCCWCDRWGFFFHRDTIIFKCLSCIMKMVLYAQTALKPYCWYGWYMGNLFRVCSSFVCTYKWSSCIYFSVTERPRELLLENLFKKVNLCIKQVKNLLSLEISRRVM